MGIFSRMMGGKGGYETSTSKETPDAEAAGATDLEADTHGPALMKAIHMAQVNGHHDVAWEHMKRAHALASKANNEEGEEGPTDEGVGPDSTGPHAMLLMPK